MPQWRKLHTKILDSIDVAEMPDDFCRVTWLMLPLIVDREGRALDDSNWIRSKLYPLRRDVTPEMVESVMCWLSQKDMIQRYEVKGRRYFSIVKFAQYQGNTEREAASVIPEPVKQSSKSRSRVSHDPVVIQSVLDSDSEEKRIDIAGAQPAPAKVADPVKELAAVFEQAAGIKLSAIPKKDQGPLFWNPLGMMVKTADGAAPEVLRAAVIQLRKTGMIVATPKSLLKTFNSIHGQRVAPSESVPKGTIYE